VIANPDEARRLAEARVAGRLADALAVAIQTCQQTVS